MATVRAGSMSAAAKQLNTTKSAVSQKLALFEAELGLTLLDRSGRAVTPTAAGLRIFEICVSPVDSAAKAEADLGLARRDEIAGRVSIAGPSSLLGTVFVPLMDGLRTRYPDIELELYADDSRTDFAASDVDLAFRTGNVTKGRYVSAAFPSVQRALYASPAFLDRVGPVDQPGRLAEIPCVLRVQEAAEWSFQDSMGRRATVEPWCHLKVNTMELAHASVGNGHGAALLPSLLAASDVENGTLVHLMPAWSVDPLKMSLLCRAERLSVPSVAAVRKYVRETCSATLYCASTGRGQAKMAD